MAATGGGGKGMKWIDVPPVWTALCIAAAWGLRGFDPQLRGVVWDGAGLALIGTALGLMVWAALTLRAARTTVIPHRQPRALVTTGPFALSRNPIYLGDLMALTGAILWIGPVVALFLVPILLAILQRRFIFPEEARLRAGFGPAFQDWSRRTRRWV